MNYRKELTNLFPTVAKNISSKKGKLAYLSLTSKPEGPIRDEFAWLLQEKLDQNLNDLISAREYSRYDLAVLKIPENPEIKENEKIKHIIEFKVGSAASFRGEFKQADKFVNRVVNDFQKGYEDENNEVSLEKMTSAFIAVEPLNRINNNQRSYIKYSARSNMLRKKIKSTNKNEFDIGEKLVEKFKDRKELKFIEHSMIKTKIFKGIQVRLHLIILSAKKEHFPVDIK